MASCHICIASKYYTRPTRGYEYFELPVDKNKTVLMDIFGPLPATWKGYKYILVLMDQFSKLTKLYPMRDQKLDSIIDALEDKHLKKIGIPEVILIDNGGQFITSR